ncbi:MAG: tripartite tricarboxylate transporter TctB family protein [Thermodesulfobacteriota bacterium]
MSDERKLRIGEVPFLWFLMALSLFVLYQAYRISGFTSLSGPGSYPLFVGAIMTLSVALLLLHSRRRERQETLGLGKEITAACRDVFRPHLLLYIGVIVAYMLVLVPLTFLPSSYFFLFLSTLLLKGAGWKKALIASAIALAAIYLVFQTIFRVMLP